MIKHHQGAIVMAQEVLGSANTSVSGLAGSIIKAQELEITRMKELLQKI
jgi:uncharacterized protein (DUF305 family)